MDEEYSNTDKLRDMVKILREEIRLSKKSIKMAEVVVSSFLVEVFSRLYYLSAVKIYTFLV